MMNDRFSVELRRHLLDTANERPADGQLASVVEQVAVTAQRRPIVARLTWYPGRIGPFPSAAVRYGLIVLALVLAALAAVALGVGGGPARTVFEGTWTATDPGDGSTLTLEVGPGDSPLVHFEDGFASGAACIADEVKVFTADGNAIIAGNRLQATFPDGGGCGTVTVGLDAVYHYDAASDTLLDQDDVRWSRVRERLGPPETPVPATDTPMTDVPATSAPATDAPAAVASDTPLPGCIEVPAGGTYEASAGSVSLTATLPVGTDPRWVGLQDRFALENGPCSSGGSAAIVARSDVDKVYGDACHWRSTSILIDTPADLVAALTAQQGHATIGPTETTIGGYPAERLQLSEPAGFDIAACDDDGDGVIADIYLWDDQQLDPDQAADVYVVDVDGTRLIVAAIYRTEVASPTLLARIDEIVASLRIAR
jgi:hypothetical protein